MAERDTRALTADQVTALLPARARHGAPSGTVTPTEAGHFAYEDALRQLVHALRMLASELTRAGVALEQARIHAGLPFA